MRVATNAEPHQHTAIVARVGSRRVERSRIAGRFACERVLACSDAREWMEEEEGARERHHPAEPQVATLDVMELVRQREADLRDVATQQISERKNDARPLEPHDERRL